MKKALLFLIMVCMLMTQLVIRVVQAEEPCCAGEASSSSASRERAIQQNLDALTRQLLNPVSSVWSLTFQFNNFLLNGAPSNQNRDQSLSNFQPVLPLQFTDELNLQFPIACYGIINPTIMSVSNGSITLQNFGGGTISFHFNW
jgi:hypothetical protein